LGFWGFWGLGITKFSNTQAPTTPKPFGRLNLGLGYKSVNKRRCVVNFLEIEFGLEEVNACACIDKLGGCVLIMQLKNFKFEAEMHCSEHC